MGYIFFLIVGFWLGHIIVFMNLVSFVKSQSMTTKIHIPLIVVLTGSKGRIEHGFKLMEKRMGDRLFITGIGENVKLNELILAQNITQRVELQNIILDYGARNTKANALAIKKWCKNNNIHHLRLVTSQIHMPRSILWIQRIAPFLKVTAEPVPQAAPHTFNQTLKEFHKWMFATWHLG